MKIYLKQPLFCYEIGQRSNNEDYIYPYPSTATPANRLFLVCDGMGGHEGGEIASKAVTESIASYWEANRDESDSAQKVTNAIVAAIAEMDQLVRKKVGNRRMGTTMTLASIGKDSILVTHVGDSRVYQIRPKVGIVYQSKDHSLVQTWVDSGLLTLEEARTHPKSNIINQVIQLGGLNSIVPETEILNDIQEGDYLFLCTDGIIESISDEVLMKILGSDISDSEKMNRIKSVCEKFSKDNFSAYLITLSLGE